MFISDQTFALKTENTSHSLQTDRFLKSVFKFMEFVMIFRESQQCIVSCLLFLRKIHTHDSADFTKIYCFKSDSIYYISNIYILNVFLLGYHLLVGSITLDLWACNYFMIFFFFWSFYESFSQPQNQVVNTLYGLQVYERLQHTHKRGLGKINIRLCTI